MVSTIFDPLDHDCCTNDLGQPVGIHVPGWIPRMRPSKTPMEGHYCRLEPINPTYHAEELFKAYQADEENRIWTYLPYGPFHDVATFSAWIEQTCLGDDPLFLAVVDKTTCKAIGVASYLRIDPKNGVIEVGHVNFSLLLQKTPAATEAMYLMMARVFDELGYRRYEWKCDALNKNSRRAAQRLGFTFEGIFRQAVVYKGRNRDTAWYAILDSEWPLAKIAFKSWLDPANFDGEGKQKRSLAQLRLPSLIPSFWQKVRTMIGYVSMQLCR
eukprot:gnl/MRDRNA2_/MRDRNA2_110937_c0_seq1.p1 gnl/MRDRNA2_/MRDRNA2_110937_c0~~gnl/MRDRNA2_/MRDRNA2_110937_c0_seq1.p1  ORF type:complete len:270 (+),score=35.27 gnl/MRDRNA2_/MRDRNA2_110937_c0_seq1:89-898(+)